MNIIFDVGGVLITWEPDAILTSLFDDAELRKRLRSEVFEHNDWIEYDRGVSSWNEVTSRIAERTGIGIKNAERLMAATLDSLEPIAGMVELIEECKTKGHRLFCLSNMNGITYARLKERYDFWAPFEGVVVSGHVGEVKPGPKIFQHLLQKYDLTAGECVFIDDAQRNVDGAMRMGINAILFESHSQCRSELFPLLQD